MKTPVINLFGPPGSGKSLYASKIYSFLKERNIPCELVREYAKDLAWEGRHDELKCQFHVTGVQVWRVQSLVDKVDVIINDSPIMMGIMYSQPEDKMLRSAIYEQFNKFENTNIFLDVDHKIYESKGRLHSKSESNKLKSELIHILDTYNVEYTSVKTYDDMIMLVNSVI